MPNVLSLDDGRRVRMVALKSGQARFGSGLRYVKRLGPRFRFQVFQFQVFRFQVFRGRMFREQTSWNKTSWDRMFLGHSFWC
jgi:hypothetical protein